MANQKKRKHCKHQSKEEFSAVGKQPTIIHTGKLLEMLNEKRKSLCKKLKHNNRSRAVNENNRERDPTQDILEELTTFRKNSLRVYATPVKATTNSHAGMSSRSFRKMIVRDDSPNVEENDTPLDSPQIERQFVANLRGCLRNIIRNQLFSEVDSSPNIRPSLLGSLENDHRGIIGERLDSPTRLKRKSLHLESIRGKSPENDELKVDGNVKPLAKEPEDTAINTMEEPQGIDINTMEQPQVLKGKRGPTKLKSVTTETSSRIESPVQYYGSSSW